MRGRIAVVGLFTITMASGLRGNDNPSYATTEYDARYAVRATPMPDEPKCRCCLNFYDIYEDSVVHQFESFSFECAPEPQELAAADGHAHGSGAVLRAEFTAFPAPGSTDETDYATGPLIDSVGRWSLTLTGSMGDPEGPCWWQIGMDVSCRKKTLLVSDPPDDTAAFHLETRGNTCSLHNMCGGEPEELNALASALESGQMDASAKLIQRLAGSVYVNSERGLVQLLDCTGRVASQVQGDVDALKNLMHAGARR